MARNNLQHDHGFGGWDHHDYGLHFRLRGHLPQRQSLVGFGWAFVMLGGFLGYFGVHMATTWPLEQIDGAFCCKVDNYTFGKSAAFYEILT
ncbi:hypothetical protein [Mobiluncus porci]|uniref:Uncharacterized protein n=1 Tax=Mobiluncus porci TaxID=2652278 RepID=A0A7K0K2A8_9ACTO|nr:hypothetical protein [Mobiluncus porci]MST49611.1 hypothetical protein [Mobiluncus porci]